MALAKRYVPGDIEPALQEFWQAEGTYHFKANHAEIFSIDTPPPTVSGRLHLGHVFSYSHTDFFARFWRMQGKNVYYPMGFDDNGLPTERLVEREHGVTAREIGRADFVSLCLQASAEAERAYRALWLRLGLSVDWRYSYRTIDEHSRRLAQWSFIDLHRKGLVYRRKAPTIWCPECRTAIAQAEAKDLLRVADFYSIAFRLNDGTRLPIATTRPELLPACVAIFVNPDDPRARELEGRSAYVPLFGQRVPVLADAGAEREKGTGVVMCCTFGDTTDVAWWYRHDLPLVEAIGPDGRLQAPAGEYAGLAAADARREIVSALQASRLIERVQPIEQAVPVHERCDTPVEIVVTRQWFVRVLDNKERFLDAAESISWHPGHMKARYRQWVENLSWDWCISRQRYFGVPFPVWYCSACDETILAPLAQLPVDPLEVESPVPCPACGEERSTADGDVMDTWATSSLSPQIAVKFDPGKEPGRLYRGIYPYSLRPQAHEIIRTWAFYTIVKSLYHFEQVPWRNIAISGWGLAPEGTEKLSKSRGGGAPDPMLTLEKHSADAVRYWAASTGLGKDSVIDEVKIAAGGKLARKLWNVARFSERFLAEFSCPSAPPESMTIGDWWLLGRCQELIARATGQYDQFDYAGAKNETEQFFWTELADNYLEMAKKRLYDGPPFSIGAQFTLYHSILATIKLLAPIMPYVTETIFHALFDSEGSIHRSDWPTTNDAWIDEEAIAAGDLLVGIATNVRRYKSEAALSLGAALSQLYLQAPPEKHEILRAAEADIASVTRADKIVVGNGPPPDLEKVGTCQAISIYVAV